MKGEHMTRLDEALAKVQRYTHDASDMMEHPEGAWIFFDETRRRLTEAELGVALPDLQIMGRAPDGSDHQLEIFGYSYATNQVSVILPGESVTPPDILNKDRIREIFMEHGFIVKEGQTDLKEYVYDAADALLREAVLQLGVMATQRVNREASHDTILADLMHDWKTGMKSSQEVCVEFFQHFSSTPALGALGRYQDHGQQHDDPTGPNHPGHHDGQTCEQAAQAQVDMTEMLYPGSRAHAAYNKEYSQFANSEYPDLNRSDLELAVMLGTDAMRIAQGKEPVNFAPEIVAKGITACTSTLASTALKQHDTGQVYGIIDPDYGRIYTMVRKLAWEEGYAIGLHGSFTRDLDMVAVPWEAGRRCNPEKLVARILQATGLKEAHGNPGIKPHGRKVWTLLLPEFGDPRFVDLSIMPCPDPQPTEGVSNE